ncbi:unnamed protein product [Rotaria socialis]
MIMIYQLISITLFVNVALSLRCKTAWPSNCLHNSTCKYDTKECPLSEISSNIRGGVYCLTIVNNDPNELIIGKMDCMYDQETSKTCKNQSQCIMNYTNKDKKFFHCCCDKDDCNQNFVINPTDEPPRKLDDPTNRCKDFLCKRITIILICLIFGFILILILICCIYRKKLMKSGKKINNLFGKEKQEITRLLEETEDTIGKIDFNDLKIETLLKKGKFSFIHKGMFNGQEVSIKQISNTDDINHSKQLFEHEKQIYSLKLMQHENILKYYGYSINNNDNYYIITELSQHGSLRDVLRSRLLKDENELLLICKQISNGLEYLHKDKENENIRPRIAHRDFKSDNILYLNENKLVICDFAMSIKLDQNPICPNEQQQIGTPRYMSPELLVGTIGCETDALLKCDVYALGIVFWEILSRYPYDKKDYDQKYELPFEKQLTARNLNSSNPQINEMLQIINLEKPLNRPLIELYWKNTNKKSFNEILSTMEQCWDQTPEGRITAALVALRMRQL